jgi:hypothetical protein
MRTRHTFHPTPAGILKARLSLSRIAAPVAAPMEWPVSERLAAKRPAEGRLSEARIDVEALRVQAGECPLRGPLVVLDTHRVVVPIVAKGPIPQAAR